MVFLDYKVPDWPVAPFWECKIDRVPKKPFMELGSESLYYFFDS